MKKLIPITLTLLLVFFASTALAERGHNRHDNDGYNSKGDRIERHMDKKGDRIERRFDRRADHAADQGKYRKARHLSKKGDRIDRHFDRRGERMHAKFDQRRHNHRTRHQHQERYVQVVSPRYAHHDIHANLFSLMIRQPGFVLGWNSHR